MASSSRHGQTLLLCIVTVIYLAFELAFNARLLDVVGGGASNAEIHAIEYYGRSLSGIAVALVVLQVLLNRRNRLGRPGFMGIALWCGASAVLTFAALQFFVDSIVATRSAAFRRDALNITLVQGALVQGRARLAGLDDDPALFAKPEGKAFLAVFPALATAAQGLESRLEGAKNELVRQSIRREYGPAALYEAWGKARKEVAGQWERYARQGGTDVEGEVARQQDKAWDRYLNTLGKKGWTPSSIPAYAKGAVLRKTRADLPTLPADWDLADEGVFREAVAVKVRQKMRGGGDGSVVVGGKRIPPGLGFEAFFAHPAIQAELRKRLDLPESVGIRSIYEKAQHFEQTVYEAWLKRRLQSVLAQYSAPVAKFEKGGELENRGEEAARAVLVPPIALFFSLLGAIGHIGKLFYLLLRLAAGLAWRGEGPSRWLGWAIAASPLLVIGIAFAILLQLDNPITESRVYTFLEAQARSQAAQETAGQRGLVATMLGGMHAVAVGQGLAYPLNEHIRTQYLGGISYGYQGAL